MFKIAKPKHRIIEYPISTEYVDLDSNLWSYRAYVQMTSDYEVLDVILTSIEVEDVKGENLDIFGTPILLTDRMKRNIKDHASNLALEKVQSIDFESEDR